MMIKTLDGKEGIIVGFNESTQMLLIQFSGGQESEYRHYELKSPDGKTVKRFLKKMWNKTLRLSGEGVERPRPRKFHMLEKNDETDRLLEKAREVLRTQFRTNQSFSTASVLRFALKQLAGE